jgi:VanZ family protein
MPVSSRPLFLFFSILWMALIYFLSSRSGVDIEPVFPGHDKLMHAFAFGVLAVCFLGVMDPRPSGYRWQQVGIAVTLAALYGLTDEFHQSFVPLRNPDALDVMADVAGAFTGTILFRYFTRRVRASNGNRSSAG